MGERGVTRAGSARVFKSGAGGPPKSVEDAKVAEARARWEEAKRQAAEAKARAESLRKQIAAQQKRADAAHDKSDAANEAVKPGQLSSITEVARREEAELRRLTSEYQRAREASASAASVVGQREDELIAAQTQVNEVAEAAGRPLPYPEAKLKRGSRSEEVDKAGPRGSPLSEAELQRLTGEVQGSLDQLPVATRLKSEINTAIAVNPLLTLPYQQLLQGSQGLPGDVQAKLLTKANERGGANTPQVAAIVDSAAWHQADPAQKAELATMVANTPSEALDSVARIAAHPNQLFDRDHKGQTLLTNLVALSRDRVDGRVTAAGQAPQELYGSVLDDLAHAERIKQSSFGTCTVTSMQYELVRDDPAEYARLMHDVGTTGVAEMRGGGQLELQAGYLKQREGDHRTLSEIVFQSAAMEYGNGAENYDEAHDTSISEGLFWDESHGGLTAEQQERAMQSLFGHPFTSLTDSSQAVAYMERYQTRAGNPPLLLNLNVAAEPGKVSSHALTFLKMENGQVYFRNPWGATRNESGTQLPGFGTVVDSASGTFSMPVEEFENRFQAIITDSEALERFQLGGDPSLANPGNDAAPFDRQRASGSPKYRQAQLELPH